MKSTLQLLEIAFMGLISAFAVGIVGGLILWIKERRQPPK